MNANSSRSYSTQGSTSRGYDDTSARPDEKHHHSRFQPVESLYNVSLNGVEGGWDGCSAHDTSYRDGVKIVFGEVRKAATTHFNVNPIDTPTPYLCLRARFTQTVFNLATLSFIALAIGASSYSGLLGALLKMKEMDLKQQCEQEVLGISALALSNGIKNQAFNGLNATIWNLEHEAYNSLDQVTRVYASSSKLVCDQAAAAADNATTKMAEWANSTLYSAQQTNRKLLDSLVKVEKILESSGYFHASDTNISTLTNYSVPRDYNHRPCRVSGNGSLFNATSHNQVSTVINLARMNLSNIINSSSLHLNLSSVETCGYAAQKAVNDIKRPTQIWVALFSVIAVCLVIPVAYVEHRSWHTLLAANKDLQTTEHDTMELISRAPFNFSVLLTDILVNSRDALVKIYLRWAVNYAIRGNVSRLLYLSLVLGIFGIANSTILSAASTSLSRSFSWVDYPQVVGWKKDAYNNVKRFEKQLNDETYKLFSHAITSLDTIFKKRSSQLAGVYGIHVDVGSPYATGMAVERFTISHFATKQIKDHEAVAPGIEIMNVMGSVNSIVWLSSITLFSIWLMVALLGLLYALWMIRQHRHCQIGKSRAKRSLFT